jgi:large repetitive protein
MKIDTPQKRFKWSRRRTRRMLAGDTALSQRFEFETFEPRILMSAALLPVHGSIDIPGQVNKYTFSLTDSSQIYFDSQTPNSSQIDWTLQGPSGTVVSNRPFAYSDANQLNGQAAMSLPAGDYTLSVAAQGATTGGYDFQLLDLANATPVTTGQQVDGKLNPGNATNLYQFQGSTGDTLFFDSHALDPQSTSWRVIGPEGTVVFGPNGLGQDSGPDTLTETGTYTLMVEGNVNQTAQADYSFTVYSVGTSHTPLSVGHSVTGTLATPGSTNDYDFSVAKSTKVLFDSLTNRGDLQWTLTSSHGAVVSQRGFNASDASSTPGDDGVLLAPGAYTLSVTGVGSAVGAYGFRVLDLSSGMPATLSDTHDGTINDAGAASQLLHTAAGAPIAPVGSSAQGPAALVLGDGQINGAIAPTAKLHLQTLTVEAWARLDFTASGENVIFQQGATGSGYALQVGSDGKLQFAVDGTTVESPDTLRLGSWTHVAGTYDGTTLRLYIDGIAVADKAFAGPIAYDTNGATIGAADSSGGGLWHGELDELRVWNTAESAATIKHNMPFTLKATAGLVGLWHLDETSGLTLADSSGNGLNATLGPIPGTSTQLLTFKLTAGQTYYLNVPASSGDLTARFYSPNGYLVFSQPLSDRAGITAEVTGNYALAIEGGVGNTAPATYSVRLVPTLVATGSLTVGHTIDDSISLPSQSVAYAFTLAAEKHLLFDTLSSGPGLQWSLAGPGGPVVTIMSLLIQDGLNSPSMPLLDLPGGDYTLTVSGVGNATGAYSFRMLDATSSAASVTSFKLGADVTAKLDVATGAVLYGFAAKAGDTVSFNVQSGADTAVWRLLDPYGRPVFGPSRVESQTGITLAATGTYVLVIKGTLDASGVASVKFASNLDSHTDPVPLTGTAITLGTAVSDSFSAANGENDYVFTVAAGARLYFDSLSTDNVPVGYSIVGPRGVESPGTTFSSADGTENLNPVEIDLPLAGMYQLRFTNGGYTGGYSFNLLDLAQPTVALPTDGSTLQATLSPANSTQVYTFDATAGTNVYVAANAANVGFQYVDVRLIDPAGRVIQGPTTIGNMVLTIPVTGIYTLLVEGERNNAYYSSAISYSLALSNIANPAPQAITLGQNVSGQIAAGSETNTYTLNLAADAKLVLSSFTNYPTVQLAFIGVDGTLRSVNLA